MPVKGTDLVSKNIVAFGGRFLAEVNKDMEQARQILDRRVEKNISLADHSLEDLAALGHPYAARSPQRIHSPSYQVHVQSGQTLRSKFSGVVKATVLGGQLMARAYVGVSDAVAHNWFLIYGTSKMIPRDFLQGSLPEVADEIWNTLHRSLKGATISFNGERRQL